MMDRDQIRLFRARIRTIEEEARRLVREIFATHEDADTREDERLVFSKADILFAAMEDALFIDPTEADPKKIRIRRMQRNTDEFFLRFAALERERREASQDLEEIEHDKKILQARHVVEAADAEAVRIQGLRLGPDK